MPIAKGSGPRDTTGQGGSSQAGPSCSAHRSHALGQVKHMHVRSARRPAHRGCAATFDVAAVSGTSSFSSQELFLAQSHDPGRSAGLLRERSPRPCCPVVRFHYGRHRADHQSRRPSVKAGTKKVSAASSSPSPSTGRPRARQAGRADPPMSPWAAFSYNGASRPSAPSRSWSAAAVSECPAKSIGDTAQQAFHLADQVLTSLRRSPSSTAAATRSSCSRCSREPRTRRQAVPARSPRCRTKLGHKHPPCRQSWVMSRRAGLALRAYRTRRGARSSLKD